MRGVLDRFMTHLPLVVCSASGLFDVVPGVGTQDIMLVIVVVALPSVTGIAGIDVV